MAINPASEYPGKTAGATVNYPKGEARNVTTPGDGTGTPWLASLINDIWGLLQGLLIDAGITESGSPDTALVSQYQEAIRKLCGNNFQTRDALALDTKLQVGEYVVTQGESAAADGKMGFYRVVAAATGTPDGENFIDLASGRQAQLLRLSSNKLDVDTQNLLATLIAPTPWQASNAQVVGDFTRPTLLNTFYYECTTAGTTGGSEPTWPTTVGLTVADGTAVWTCRQATSINEILLAGDQFSTLLSAPVAVTAATTLTAGAFGKLHEVSGTSVDYTIDLPTAVSQTNRIIGFRVDDAATKIFTLDGSGAETIDGATTLALTAGAFVTVYSDGANWKTINKDVGTTAPTNPAFFQVEGEVTRNASGGGEAAVILPTEKLDIGGNYNQPSGEFTAPVAGYYEFGLFGGMDINTATSTIFHGAIQRDQGSGTWIDVDRLTVDIGNAARQACWIKHQTIQFLAAGEKVRIAWDITNTGVGLIRCGRGVEIIDTNSPGGSGTIINAFFWDGSPFDKFVFNGKFVST